MTPIAHDPRRDRQEHGRVLLLADQVVRPSLFRAGAHDRAVVGDAAGYGSPSLRHHLFERHSLPADAAELPDTYAFLLEIGKNARIEPAQVLVNTGLGRHRREYLGPGLHHRHLDDVRGGRGLRPRSVKGERVCQRLVLRVRGQDGRLVQEGLTAAAAAAFQHGLSCDFRAGKPGRVLKGGFRELAIDRNTQRPYGSVKAFRLRAAGGRVRQHTRSPSCCRWPATAAGPPG